MMRESARDQELNFDGTTFGGCLDSEQRLVESYGALDPASKLVTFLFLLLVLSRRMLFLKQLIKYHK